MNLYVPPEPQLQKIKFQNDLVIVCIVQYGMTERAVRLLGANCCMTLRKSFSLGFNNVNFNI